MTAVAAMMAKANPSAMRSFDRHAGQNVNIVVPVCCNAGSKSSENAATGPQSPCWSIACLRMNAG
jgi:hypothetical protein